MTETHPPAGTHPEPVNHEATDTAASAATHDAHAATHEADAPVVQDAPAEEPAPEAVAAAEPDAAPVAEDVIAPIPQPEPVAPPPVTPVVAPAAAPAAAPVQKAGTPVWMTAAVAILLGGGLYYVWQNPAAGPVASQDATPAAAPAADPRVAALEAALKTAEQRIAALEQRPASVAAGTEDGGRLAALEQTVRALSSRPAADPSALEARLATLEKRPAAVVPDVAGASAALSAKIEALDAKLQQDVAQAAARGAQAARLRAATAALDAGQPLGDIPLAPAALSKFATAAPPTEPALRLSFGQYAAAAEAASRPSAEGHDFAERMWMRVQTLVTVRQGTKILVGAPAAVTLEAARGKLDAGDLAGAVAALAALDPAATQAMAPWKTQAQSLLDARAALATLAAKS